MAGSLQLKVFKGDACVGAQPLDQGIVKIGRNATATIRLDDERASRVHAVLSIEKDGRVSIVHMGSPEGTFLNGKRIGKAYLRPGDEIRIGATRLVVESAAETTLSPVPKVEKVARLATSVAVVEPLPQPEPPAPELLESGGPLGLRIQWLWGERLLGTHQLDRPREVYIGTTRRSIFAPPSKRREQLLLTREGTDFALVIDGSMTASLWNHGRWSPLGEGRQSLEPGMRARLEWGGLRAELGFFPQPPRIEAPLWRSRELRRGGILFAAILLLMGGVRAILPPVTNASSSDATIDRARVLFHEAARPKANPLLAQLVEQKKQEKAAESPGEAAPKHRDDEGESGKREAPRRETRSAPRAIVVGAEELAHSSSVLKEIASAASAFGKGGLGGDLRGAVGKLSGARVGDAHGNGGLGLKGTGTGGGGLGQTIGIGGVGTKGRGGGLGTYGQGMGALERKRGIDPMLDDGDTVVQGELDRELIRQVIRRNIGQIRYCYESELQVKPGLAGRVSMQFTIAPGGEVTSARAAGGSTLADPRVKECIAARMRGWKFPSPKGGGSVLVTYPFVFKPSGE